MRTIPWRTFWIEAVVAASIFILVPRNVAWSAEDSAAGRRRDTVIRSVPSIPQLDGRGGIHLALRNEPLSSRLEPGISGKMNGESLEEANDLALVLRDGARASLVAVGFVVMVLAVYYGVPGLLVVAALLPYILYAVGGLAALGFTATLPGLAGFALAAGMAVDANVLIFERIREEMNAGKSTLTAVNAGYSHAMSAIVDSSVTTALTALIIYLVGTGPVKGFAIALFIGLCASMVSAVFVTRPFLLAWLQRKPAMTRLRKFTMRVFANTNCDFIDARQFAYAVSAAFIVPGALLLATVGLTYSIAFTGGTLVEVRTESPVDPAEIRLALDGRGLGAAEIQSLGSDREYAIRVGLAVQAGEGQTAAGAEALRGALDAGLGADQYEVTRDETVPPKVGRELRQKALIGILFSAVTTLLFLAFRFEWPFGVAAVIAAGHAILATLAFIRYFSLEVSPVVVAALVTIVGYSLNDMIVLFDRVRENLRSHRADSLIEVLNRAINETLPRTILTGSIMLATALVLSWFAGDVIKPFALVVSFGIVAGTFSSIFVAAPVLLWIRRRWSGEHANRATTDGSPATPFAP